MTHAEQYSTSEPGACPTALSKPRRRNVIVTTVAAALAFSGTMAVVSSPVSADTVSSLRAQAAQVSSQLAADQSRIQAIDGQVQAADYHLSQLNQQIAATKAQQVKDQKYVDADRSQLRKQAINDYTRGGTSNQVTDMFSGNLNANGIQHEYSSIATGNVTATIDRLHTAESQLAATTSSLQSQKAQVEATQSQLSSEKHQAESALSQAQATKNGLSAQLAQAVAQELAAQAAAARSRAEATLAAAHKTVAQQQAGSGGGASSGGSSSGSSGGGSGYVPSTPAPPTLPGAAGAVQAAEGEVGVPYVWGGASPGTGFDCSGLVEWAYAQVGISLPHYSGAQYQMTAPISLGEIAPGDLLFYGPGGDEHVAMYVGGGMMVEAPQTGYNVHITPIRTGDGFAGVGRVS